MKNAIAKFLRDESGATAVEYGLLVGLISLAIIAVVTTLGTQLNRIFLELVNKLSEIAKAKT